MPNPPKLFHKFFRLYCHPRLRTPIEGDLMELYDERVKELGKKKADMHFIKDTLLLFRKDIIKPIEGTQKLNHYGMLKHSIKISWRNALRQKQFTVLNLLGLSIGIATVIIISLYIEDELTYDRFHEKADRIYRVNQPDIWGDWEELISSTGPNVAVALREEAPEFEEVTRMLGYGDQTVRLENAAGEQAIFKENAYFAAEENFLEVFTFDLLAGDSKSALDEPGDVILTEETAHRYFGKDKNPADLIGKAFSVKNWDGSWQDLKISAIAKDIPNKSHIQFDLLVSLKTYQEQMDRDGWKWIWTGFSTYGLVHEGTDVAALERKIQAIPPKWAPPTTERIFNQSFEDFTKGNPWRLDLQPVKEIYSGGYPYYHRFGPTSNPLFIQTFGAVGLLVLILSAINFMNLSTARSSLRSKEVGVQKVLGSDRAQLVKQFYIESILYVAIGALIAIFIAQFSLDWFNQLTNKEIDLLSILSKPQVIGLLILFVILLGVAAGSYPAIYLSSFKPIQAFKGQSSQGFKGKALRNGLVVFQFSISIALIICSAFVQKQITYGSTLNLGFDRNNILQIHNIEQFGFDTQTLKTNLQNHAAINKVGKSFGVPPNIWSGDRYKAVGENQEVVQFSNVRTEEDYLDVLGVTFLAGRNFDLSRTTDKYKIIINETAAKTLGWGDASSFQEKSPIGKKIAIASGDEDEFEVIGVVGDFHFNGLRLQIKPLIIIHHENDQVWDYGAGLSFLSIRLDPSTFNSTDDLVNLIDDVEHVLAETDPSVPFEFSFLDQDFENTFRREQQVSMIMNIFTLMALVIGCLGLFGLAAFSAEQRTKELGIRKVLGASISQLIYTFSTEFTKLVGIAILIASPLAWYLVSRWFEEFAYSTSIDWWVFVAATLGALLVAGATVSYQAIRSANRNPVETLKDE